VVADAEVDAFEELESGASAWGGTGDLDRLEVAGTGEIPEGPCAYVDEEVPSVAASQLARASAEEIAEENSKQSEEEQRQEENY
jgi:hypothetical protein